MRKINTRFFVFLVVGLVLATGVVFGLHRLQAGNIADALRWQAQQAETEGKLDRAAKYLGRYLEFARDDLDEREHLATILSEPVLATTPQRRARARFVMEQVLAKDPERHATRRRLCQSLIQARMFESAREHLTYLEKHQPATADVAFLRGQWHEAQGQSAAAIEAYRLAIQRDAAQADAYVRVVPLLQHSDFGKEPKHAAEIERLVMTALEKAPNDAAILSLAARLAQEKGDLPAAFKYLEDGLKHDPSEPRLYLALAHLHSQDNKRGEAIARLTTGLANVRKDRRYELRWTLANLLIDDNRLDDAAKITKEVRDTNPVSADYLDARCQMQRGRWFEAARQLEKIRPALKSIKELSLQTDLYLGACYEQMDEPALQLNAFQRAAQTDPTSLIARRGLAGARWALGQPAEALAIHHELIQRTTDVNDAARRRIEYVRLMLQSGLQRNPKEWQRIEDELTQIEKTLVKSLDVSLLRAEFCFAKDEKAKAEAILQDAIKEHPDRFEPWVALIFASQSKKDPALTRQLMQTAEDRFKAKVEFRLAQIRFWTLMPGEAGAALKALESEIATFTPREQAALLQALAEAHYDAQRYADSTRALERMLPLPSHVHDVRLRLQLLELALLQDDDGRARTMVADIKRLEGDGGADGSLGEAMRLMRLGRKGQKDAFDQARHLLTVAAAHRPNWHPVIQARAELDELQGRPDQAIANYRRALDLGSRDPNAMKQLMFLLSQAHRYDEVEQVLARMHKQYGATQEVVRYYVANSFQRRDFKKAEGLIKQVVAGNSTNYRDHLWMGQILAASGQAPKDAEKAFRRAIELAPERPETWIHLVRHLVSLGQNAEAKKEIEQAGTTLPADRRELTVAQCSELLGFLKDAAENYAAAIDKHPASPLMHRAAADFCLRMTRNGEAEALYRKMIEHRLVSTDDDVAALRRGLALALARQNRPAKTAEVLKLVGLALNDNGALAPAKLPDALDEQLLQARVLASIHHHHLRGHAITMLEALQQKNALAAEDQFVLARLYAQQGLDAAGWTKARALLKTLNIDQPKNPRYLAYAAHLHIQQKEYTEAEAFVARLENAEAERKTMPGAFGSIELRAKMLELRGRGSQAAALLTEYADQPEASPARKLLLAGLQGRLGNFRAAIDLCDAVRQTKTHANEANIVAVDLLRANRPSEAQPTKHRHWQAELARLEATLRGALEKAPRDVSLRLHFADLMELQGKYDVVESLCREVLKNDENHLVALNNLAWLLGQNPNTAAEALTLVQRAIDMHGARPELLDTRAIVRLNLGKTDDARRDLERVVNEAPTPARLFHLCQVYEKSRNTASAVAMLRRAQETGLTVQHLHPAEQPEYQRVVAELSKRQ